MAAKFKGRAFLEEVSTWRFALTEAKVKIMDNNIRSTKTTAEVLWGHTYRASRITRLPCLSGVVWRKDQLMNV